MTTSPSTHASNRSSTKLNSSSGAHFCCSDRRAAVCVTYWANRLQPLPPGAPNLFVTLNPIHPPAGEPWCSAHRFMCGGTLACVLSLG